MTSHDFMKSAIETCIPGTGIMILPTITFSAVTFKTIDVLWRIKTGHYCQNRPRAPLREWMDKIHPR